jgi:1-deoxyxylulose-5-phosphate synthase
MSLPYRQLGRSDLCLSSIGLGCVTFGREIDAATSLQVLDRARERGINWLDTAAVYGSGASEQVIGQWLGDRKSREEIVLATKVTGRLTRQDIVLSVEESLRRLRTDRIDLLQAHQWDSQTPLDETLRAFDDLVRQGKVRYCGSSNWTAEQLDRALDLAQQHGWNRLESVQVIYNLVDRQIEGDLLPLCARQRVGVLSYSPVGAGFLTGKYRRGGPIPKGTRFDVIPGHQAIYFTDYGFRMMERLREMASRVGRPMAQLALAWVLWRPGITSVLIGAREPAHIDQAFDSLAAGLPEEILRLEEMIAFD